MPDMLKQHAAAAVLRLNSARVVMEKWPDCTPFQQELAAKAVNDFGSPVDKERLANLLKSTRRNR